MAPGLPIQRSGDFGTSPFFGSSSDKPLPAPKFSDGGADGKEQWATKNSVSYARALDEAH
jgi:hypothetical protein